MKQVTQHTNSLLVLILDTERHLQLSMILKLKKRKI